MVTLPLQSISENVSDEEMWTNPCFICFRYFVVQYPQEFLDAMFAFLSFVISFQTGGNMVISAGLVPILLQLLINKRVNQLKVCERTIISSAYHKCIHLTYLPKNL